jgi:serine/threonine-protein kinase
MTNAQQEEQRGAELDQVVPGYRLLARLGAGGAGEVYAAEHVGLGKKVAVKILRRDHAGDARQVERMRIDAQSAARVRHPNVVESIHCGVLEDGRPFFVMTLVEGRSLAEEIQLRGSLPWREAVDVTRSVLAGLGAAHALGVVHRDVKPANVMYGPPDAAGRRDVKLVDFGVAKILADAGPRAPAPSMFPTEEGAVVGTIGAIAPELIRGQVADPRADVYGAAILLYVCVAGRGPFDRRDGELALLLAQASEPAPSLSVRARSPVPLALDAVVATALATDPAHRFADTRAFSDALAGVFEQRAEIAASHGTEMMVTTPLAPWTRPAVALDDAETAISEDERGGDMPTTEPLPSVAQGPHGTELVPAMAARLPAVAAPAAPLARDAAPRTVFAAPRPSRWLFAVAGVILALVLAIVVWMLTRGPG